jgi:ABC-2 type transport system permease protein
MTKTWLVLKHEFITTVTRRSFLLSLVLVPVISGLVMLVVSILGQDTGQIASNLFSPPQKQLVEGFVDQANIVQSLPADVSAERLKRYSTEQEARQDLTGGTIDGYYLVPPGYLANGEVSYVRKEFNPLTGLDQAGLFGYVLNYNLLGEDQQLTDLYNQPLIVTLESLAEQPVRDQDNPLTFFLPYAITMLFYILILTSAGFMLNNITTEKQNRMLEILMVSITPRQMLSGKIIALGIVGLLQTLLWFGAGLVMMRVVGQPLNLPAAFQLPVSILAWGAVYFILGYALYASLMAGVGAMVPNLREASQATTVMVIPMIIPLLLINALIQDPNGVLSTVISLFPLTAPVAMMTRLGAGSVPLWQLLLSVVLLLLTSIMVIRVVAGLFRSQVLLSGQPFQIKRFLAAFVGKA